MPTVWSENDLITAEKLNNTGIDDVLDLGVIEIGLAQEPSSYNGTLTEDQTTKLEKCKYVKFKVESSDMSVEQYIPLVQKAVMTNQISYTFMMNISGSLITCAIEAITKSITIQYTPS